jgi:hypothetical protein
MVAPVALDGPQDLGIVVDGQQDGLAWRGTPSTCVGIS